MVQAILDNRKTSTRRIIKNIPKKCDFQGIVTSTTGSNSYIGKLMFGVGCSCTYVKPPYQVGDILYVRETWQECCRNHVHNPIAHSKYCYKSSINSAFYGCIEECGNICKWHPSTNMPKEAARIFLKVTDVRVERVQDITEEGARAEGMSFRFNPGFDFMCTWDNIYAKQGNGWNENPWVWVIEFERVEK